VSDEVSHLTAGAAELLDATVERRIRAIRSRRWVLYPRAKQALDRLSQLLLVPRGTRMPSVAIYDDSGMGKTMIMKRFREEHPPSFNPTTGTPAAPENDGSTQNCSPCSARRRGREPISRRWSRRRCESWRPSACRCS